MHIRDRIKDFRRVPAATLKPNPLNWRAHPQHQQDALRGVLAEIGYAGALIARELDDGTLELIDGHLRAETTPDQDVPVLVLDVDEREAKYLLATIDPLGALAEQNAEILGALLQDVSSGSPAVQEMLAGLYEAEAQIEETFEKAPEDVQANIAEMREMRKRGNEAVREKTDTEKYLIIVFPSRESKQKTLKRLGLPEDERIENPHA